jgi:LysM repeat protein
MNGMRGDQILVGQRLKIGENKRETESSAYRYHTVGRGDTLSGLAEVYGTSVTRIMRLNGLHSDNIRIGQKLKISGAGNRFLKPELVRISNLNPKLWRNIIAHHSAIREGNAAIYGRAHKRRGMINGLAYHFVIGNGIDSGDGEIEIGPRWTGQIEGGHVKSRAYNLTSIGVCVIGDFQKFKPTANQLVAFRELVTFLKHDLLGGKPKFYVHKDLEQTACPGKNFPVSAMHKEFG